MANYVVSDTSLTSVANAIRSKGGTSAALAFPSGFVSAISALDGGGSGPVVPSGDGKTHIHIYIEPNTPANRRAFTLRWTQSEGNGVVVNWGDGSSEQSFSDVGIGNNYSHTYSSGGWYDISLNATNGTMSFDGSASGDGSSIYGPRTNDNLHNRFRVRLVELGNNVTSIGIYAFNLCSGMTRIILSNNITSIAGYGLAQCSSLTYITIPESVTAIYDNAFYNCYGMSEYHMLRRTPPSLSSTTAFAGIRSDAKIYVPAGCKAAYISATNWSALASYIEEESA